MSPLRSLNAGAGITSYRYTVPLELEISIYANLSLYNDELVFEVPEAQSEEVRKLVVSEMESVLDLNVPIKVDAH